MELNTLPSYLNKPFRGSITELSDECDLPSKDEYMRPSTKEQLHQYLIRDVVGIIQQYTDWTHLDHIPLFSVPLSKFRERNDILFLYRTDQRDYIFDETERRISNDLIIPGYFPLLMTCEEKIVTEDDPLNIHYVVGYYHQIEQPKNLQITESLSAYEETIQTLHFRSPSYSDTQAIDIHLTRIGKVVHIQIPRFETVSTKSNRIVFTTFGLRGIQTRFRPDCVHWFSVNLIATFRKCVETQNRSRTVCGFVRIDSNGHVLIIGLNEIINLQTVGFDNIHVTWLVN